MPKTNRRVAKPLKTLVALRKTLDLRQKEMADVLECSLDTIKSLEQGRLKLSEALAIRISLETGVDTQWLLANDLTRPIKPSSEACFLHSKAHNAFPKGYTSNLFDMIQASKKEPLNTSRIYSEQLFALEDHARLRAAIENARLNRLHDVARFKLDRFIDQFEAEFGSDPAVFQVEKHEPEHALNFVEAELRSATHLLALMRCDDDKYSEMSPGAKHVIEAHLKKMRTTSPYPKLKKRAPAKPLTEDDL